MYTPTFKMSKRLEAWHNLKAEKDAAVIRTNAENQPLLKAWHKSEEHPNKGPIYEVWQKASAAASALLKDLDEKIKAAKEKCHEAEIGQWWADWKNWVYSDENAKEYNPTYGQVQGAEESISPCGRYKLTLTNHPTGPGTWGYSKGKLTDLEDPEKEALEVRRNYGHFWYTWAEKDGKTYLWCGEDYQSYTLVSLEDWSYKTQYVGFCWVDAEVSPDSNVLLVYGCYWAAPYQYKVYSWPDAALWPLLEVGNIDSPYPSEDGGKGVEWLENGNLRVYVERLCRISDGLDLEYAFDRDEITEEEYDRLENTMMKSHEGEPEAEYRKDWTVWERPTPQKLYEDLVAWYTRMQGFWEKYPKYKESEGKDGKQQTEERIFRQMELVWNLLPEGHEVKRVHP